MSLFPFIFITFQFLFEFISEIIEWAAQLLVLFLGCTLIYMLIYYYCTLSVKLLVYVKISLMVGCLTLLKNFIHIR